MVTIDQISWKNNIAKGIEKAKQIQRSVLIHEVLSVDHLDPISFFISGSSSFKGERFFWKDPNRTLILVGCGIGFRYFSNSQINSYQTIEQEWNQLIHDRLLDGESIEGCGPLLFGGFSFDPKKPKSPLWENYHDIHFYLPAYLLTIKENGTYLSINVHISPHDQLESISLPTLDWIIPDDQEKVVQNEIKPIQITQKEVEASEWKDVVTQVISQIRKNEAEKVVLARELQLTSNHLFQPELAITKLIAAEKQAYIFALESGTDCFLGATPERLIRKEQNKLFSTCLAGSSPRGKTLEEDHSLGNNLLTDQKNRTEHQFVVDMIRTALEPECQSIDIPDEPILMMLTHIQHLYTPVMGIGNKKASLFRLVERLHPTPALGGWPKHTALEIIREKEPLDRGLYGAPLGWVDAWGNGEFIVAIRSALLKENNASLFAGCGVVRDSDPEAEYQETSVKFKSMLSVLGGDNFE